MTTVPQEIIDMIIGFLVEDRSSLLACSLVGSSFCSPSRAHLFANIEVNSLQRFRGLLKLSTASQTTFDHESLKMFSWVHTISFRDVDTWVTPEILPSLLFLPLLAPFPRIKDFRIDNLALPGHVEEGTLPMLPTLKVGGGWRFGVVGGVSADEPLADSPNFPTSPEPPVANLKALSLRNCQVPSVRWLLHYVSYFPCLECLSLVDFTWRSIGEEDTGQNLRLQCRPGTPRRLLGLSELTLEVQCTPSPPRVLLESFSGSLRILRLTHIDMFLSVDEGSIYLDPSYINLSSLNSVTHLTLPPVAVWLQAKQRWLPDLLSTVTGTSKLKELNIHLLFSPVAIEAQLDAVEWSKVDLILGRNFRGESELGTGNGTRTRRRAGSEGCIFTDLEVVKITSADFNPERPPLDGHAKSRIKGGLIGYMPRIHERRILQVPSND